MRKRAALVILTAAAVMASAVPANAAFLFADLTVAKKGVVTGDDVFNGNGITNPQIVKAKVKKKATFTVCVQNQPGSGGPSPNDFSVQGKGDQKGWKASWREVGGGRISDAAMVAGAGPYSLTSGDDACFTLKIARTTKAKKRAKWVLIGNVDGDPPADGDHVSVKVTRKG